MPPNGPKAFLNGRRPAGPYARVPSGPRNGAAAGAPARPAQQQQKRKSKGSSIVVSNLPGDVSEKDVVVSGRALLLSVRERAKGAGERGELDEADEPS